MLESGVVVVARARRTCEYPAAFHRALKLARACADLAAEPQIRRSDVSEAIGLRALDCAP